MLYHNKINTELVDSQTVGIFVIIPVTGFKLEPIISTYKECEKCKCKQNDFDIFCSRCGGKVIEITGTLKTYSGFQQQAIPIPDVRSDMKKLGIENHLPFREDFDDGDECDWVFPIQEYIILGHTNHYESFFEEINFDQIQNDLIEAKQKFNNMVTKYNGKIIFGVAGKRTDW